MMVQGTGRRGRVTKKDIVAFIERTGNGNGGSRPSPRCTRSRRTGRSPSPSTADSRQLDGLGELLSPMRKQIGEHMVRSLQTAAHCTTIVEADMSAIEAARGRLSYLPLVAKATIAALREHPQLNATMEGDRLIQHEEVHLGIAVALGDDGLIVPVVRNAHELSHEGLAARIKDLAERARGKRLEPDEVGGGTFTITNPGRFGALLATPIINQPQVAILDLEAVVKRPVVVSDEQGRDSIAIRPMTYFCMSWDHRALDGVLAAKFLGVGAAQRRGVAWLRSSGSRRLGQVPYREALALQERLRDARQADAIPDTLLLLEHPPVYTKGRRAEPSDLPMGEDWYRAQGIDVADSDRGGQVTYHGPGQLVGYPIMRVREVPAYVHALERVMITALADEGIEAEVRDGLTGVWAGDSKIGSIGVHVSRGVTTHGFAVNVDGDLQPFEWIVPCGMEGARMTSVLKETGRTGAMPCFRKRVAWRFAEAFGLRQRLVSTGAAGARRPR